MRVSPYSKLGPDVPPRQLKPMPHGVWFHDDRRAKLDFGTPRHEMPHDLPYRASPTSSAAVAADQLTYQVGLRHDR